METIKKIIAMVAGLMAVLAFAVVAYAAATTTNQVVTPTSPVFDANNVVGVPGDSAPGFPSGSIASDGTEKTDMYFTPDSLFGREVTLGEVSKISYWTKKDTTHVADAADWFLAIYTEPYPGDVSAATWYGDRIGTEPYFSINLNDPDNTWNNWTTDGSINQLRFFESTLGYFGSYTDPDWATFVGGNALSDDPYGSHAILFFSVQTGSAWADGFTGQVDGLIITLTDGSVANVNFEPNIVRHAEITSPTAEQDVHGMVNFTASLVDDDTDAIQWAVRQGTCAAGTNTIFGNVDGHSEVATIDQSNLSHQTFSFTGDMSTMDSGMYCFIYNPIEDSGESDVRETVEFNLVKATPTNKDECKGNGWKDWLNPVFRNQGDCVSFVQTQGKAYMSRFGNIW